MNQLDYIREQIRNLCKNDSKIHIDISIQHPRLCLKNDPAQIKELYPRVFVIEENSTGVPQRHTLQYTDVLTRQIIIRELEEGAR